MVDTGQSGGKFKRLATLSLLYFVQVIKYDIPVITFFELFCYCLPTTGIGGMTWLHNTASQAVLIKFPCCLMNKDTSIHML